jgi:hypothetical protein
MTAAANTVDLVKIAPSPVVANPLFRSAEVGLATCVQLRPPVGRWTARARNVGGVLTVSSPVTKLMSFIMNSQSPPRVLLEGTVTPAFRSSDPLISSHPSMSFILTTRKSPPDEAGLETFVIGPRAK